MAHAELDLSTQQVCITGNDDSVSDPEQSQPSEVPGLTKGEYSKLLMLLQRAQIPPATVVPSSVTPLASVCW